MTDVSGKTASPPPQPSTNLPVTENEEFVMQLRPVILQAGIRAGIAAALTLVAIGLALGAAVWIWQNMLSPIH